MKYKGKNFRHQRLFSPSHRFYLFFQSLYQFPELDCTLEVQPVGSFPHLYIQFDDHVGDQS